MSARSGDAPKKEAAIRSAMTHDGCGGTYEKTWSRGGARWSGFRCSRCEAEIAWKARQPKYEPPTACGPTYHVPSRTRGDGVCYCGAVRFRSDDCPTCGLEWDRQESITDTFGDSTATPEPTAEPKGK